MEHPTSNIERRLGWVTRVPEENIATKRHKKATLLVAGYRSVWGTAIAQAWPVPNFRTGHRKIPFQVRCRGRAFRPAMSSAKAWNSAAVSAKCVFVPLLRTRPNPAPYAGPLATQALV